MRVIVTGAAGFIGSHVVRRLLGDGHAVTGIDRRRFSAGELSAHSGFTPIEADLAHLRLNEVLAGADAVIHLAGRPGLGEAAADYARDNVEVTARLGAAAVQARVKRFVHASSSSVYGRVAVGDESAPTRPASAYGESKLAAEQVLTELLVAAGLPLVMLRFFSVYGPGQRPDMGVRRAIDAALTGQPFPLHGDGSQTRSMTYVGDAVASVAAALDLGPAGSVYNIGGGAVHAMTDVLEEIAVHAGVAVPVMRVPRPAGIQDVTDADWSSAARDLGYRPITPLSEGIANQVAWQARSVSGLGDGTLEAAG